MSDRALRALVAREKTFDNWIEASRGAVYDPRTRDSVELQKTIIMCTKAIVEAIWKARF